MISFNYQNMWHSIFSPVSLGPDSDVEGLLLTLTMRQGPYGVLEIKPRSDACKASALTPCIFYYTWPIHTSASSAICCDFRVSEENLVLQTSNRKTMF